MTTTPWLLVNTYTAGTAGSAWLAVNAARFDPAGSEAVADALSASEVHESANLTNVSAGIPSGDTIQGVEIELDYYSDQHTGTIVTQITLLSAVGATIGTAKSSPVLPSSATTSAHAIQVLGGPADTWGAALTPAIVNAAGFGFDLLPQRPTGTSTDRPRYGGARIRFTHANLTPPTVSSRTTVDQNTVDVTYDMAMDQTSTVAGHSFRSNTVALSISSMTWQSSTVARFVFTDKLSNGETIDHSYDSVAGDTQSTGSIALASFTTASVANTLGIRPSVTSITSPDTGATGTASAGASSTITLAAGSSAVNGFYNGARIHIDSGTGIYQTRWITAYDGATKVATVDRAWTTIPDGASVYTVFSGGVIDVVYSQPATWTLTGSINSTGWPLFAHASGRVVSQVKAPISGDGTTTHRYRLPLAQPFMSGESLTASISANTVANAGAWNDAASIAVTNNSTQATTCMCRICEPHAQWLFDAGVISGAVQAGGTFGPGDGISQVVVTVSDGTNSISQTVTTRTASTLSDQLNLYLFSVDPAAASPAAIVPGTGVTITAVATPTHGQTRSDVMTVTYDDGTLSKGNYFLKTTGLDTNAGTSASPLRSLRGAATKARAAGNDYAIATILDNGDYLLGDAQITGGVTYAGNIYARLNLDLGIGGPLPDNANARFTDDGTNKLNVSYLDSTHSVVVQGGTIRGVELANETSLAQMNNVIVSSGAIYTSLHPALNIAGISALFASSNPDNVMYNCTIPACLTMASAEFIRNVTIGEVDGDVVQNCPVAVGAYVTGTRSAGTPVFTVIATGVGVSTITKAAGVYTLTDTNGTLNIDATLVANDTLVELIASINARTGWTATSLRNSDWDSYSSHGDGSSTRGVVDFPSTDATSVQTIYVTTEIHSDLIQHWLPTNANIVNTYVRDKLDLTRLGTSGGASATNGTQVFWFDHGAAGVPATMTGGLFAFVEAAQFSTSFETPRSVFFSDMSDIVFAFNSVPDRRHNLGFGGGSTPNSEFVPLNVTLTNNAVYAFDDENTPNLDFDGLDLVIDNNNFDDAASNYLGTNSTTDPNATAFVDYASAVTVDLHPGSSSLLKNRIESGQSLHGLADRLGTLVRTDGTGDIGAIQSVINGPPSQFNQRRRSRYAFTRGVL